MSTDIARLIAGGILGLISCYIGLLVKRHYAARERFYRDAEAFAAFLGSEVGLHKTPLPELIDNFAEGRKGEFAERMRAFGSRLAGGAGRERAAHETAEETTGLRREEKKEFATFLRSLGGAEFRTQLEEAARAEKMFAEKRAVTAEQSVRLGGMWFKLAVLVGIALIVLFA